MLKNKPRILLVVLNDRLSVISSKGEFVPRYYNPGDIFDEVHFLLLNDDKPKHSEIQVAVGHAAPYVHNISTGVSLFALTLAWTPFLLRLWAKFVIIQKIKTKPDLVRCYGNWLNGFLGAEIKRTLSIPLVLSLHGNPDVDYYRGRRAKSAIHRLYGWASNRVESVSLKYADYCIAVYSPILSYLERRGVTKCEVVHNVVGIGIEPKIDYSLSGMVINLLCVGRQDSLEKNPRPIIDAIRTIPNACLTLVGSGDLHEWLVNYVREIGLVDRVYFIPALQNDKVLKLMKKSDIYVYSSDNYEISKSTMEAALCGLPVVLNDRNSDPARELVGGHFSLVCGSANSYHHEIMRLANSEKARRELGQRARSYALKNWDPQECEKRAAEIHLNFSNRIENK